MTTPDDHLVLAAEFPAATREQWLKLVDGVLKGAPFDKKLVSRSYDGLPIEPLYPRDPLARPLPGRAPGAPWQVIQRVDHPDPAAANAEALHDLENGATGLSLVFAGSVGAYGYGLDASESTLARVLDGVYLDAGISLELDLASDQGCGARARCHREAPRHPPGGDRHPLRLRSDPRPGGRRRKPDAVERHRPDFHRCQSRTRGARVSRAVRRRRRPHRPRGRRLGGAGTRLRARRRRRLSARPRSRRHRARRRAGA